MSDILDEQGHFIARKGPTDSLCYNITLLKLAMDVIPGPS